MKWTLPNILTVLRLFAAPGVPVMFLYFNRPWADWLALLLFSLAAITDYFDGYLARAWKQESKFGQMLDPIADKVMVVIALVVITGYSGMNPWLILPTTLILFREVFVSGLREFLGSDAGTLSVTNLAKWKTTAQMLAIAVLFLGTGLDQVYAEGVNANETWVQFLGTIATTIGLILIWIAAALTVITGYDYFRKAMPYLRDDT